MAPARTSPSRPKSFYSTAYKPQDAAKKGMISIPAQPYDYTFAPRNTALLVIDLQREFIERGGYGDIQAGGFSKDRFDNLISNVGHLFQAARSAGILIIHTREGHRADLSDLPYSKIERQKKAPDTQHNYIIGDQGPNGSRLMVRGQTSHDIVTPLQPRVDEIVIDKPGKGAFFATNLDPILHDRQITHLLVIGVTAECCIATTIREANDRGYDCCAIADCIDGFHESFARTSLEMLSFSQGLFGFVASDSGPLITALNGLSQDKISTTAHEIGDHLDDIESLQRRYRRGLCTPVAIASLCLERIEAYEKVDPAVWITRATRQEILNRAHDLADRFPDPSNRPCLYGIPFAVKDNIDVEGFPTTAAYTSLTSNVASTSAASVQLLLDQGAIFLGKTNLDQFATGLVGTRSPYGAPKCVVNRNYISGGSSSGSAVAVAAGLVSFSLGTDTAASGRVPAAFNGIIGFKGTVGSVSTEGVIPACPTLDCVTIFAKKVEMASQVSFSIQDSHALSLRRGGNFRFSGRFVGRAMSHRPFTFGLPSVEALLTCEPLYQHQFAKVVTALERLGGTAVPFNWLPFEQAAEMLYSSALVAERYASILRYTKGKLKGPLELHTLDVNVQAALSTAGKYSALDVYDAMERLKTLQREAQASFSTNVDFLLTPTAPCHPTLQEVQADPVKISFRLGTFAQSINLLDLCALAMPAGHIVDEAGLERPFGVQLVAMRDEDGYLTGMARRLQSRLHL